jgi:hypothetical protein
MCQKTESGKLKLDSSNSATSRIGIEQVGPEDPHDRLPTYLCCLCCRLCYTPICSFYTLTGPQLIKLCCKYTTWRRCIVNSYILFYGFTGLRLYYAISSPSEEAAELEHTTYQSRPQLDLEPTPAGRLKTVLATTNQPKPSVK